MDNRLSSIVTRISTVIFSGVIILGLLLGLEIVSDHALHRDLKANATKISALDTKVKQLEQEARTLRAENQKDQKEVNDLKKKVGKLQAEVPF